MVIDEFTCDICRMHFDGAYLDLMLWEFHDKTRCKSCAMKEETSCSDECIHWKDKKDGNDIKWCTIYSGPTVRYRNCYRKSLKT